MKSNDGTAALIGHWQELAEDIIGLYFVDPTECAKVGNAAGLQAEMFPPGLIRGLWGLLHDYGRQGRPVTEELIGAALQKGGYLTGNDHGQPDRITPAGLFDLLHGKVTHIGIEGTAREFAAIARRVGILREWPDYHRRLCDPSDQTILADIRELARWANESADVEGTRPVLVSLADVEPVAVRWLWPNRVPLGRITLLVGRPGEGKSILTLDMAARVSTGTPWPDGTECPAGSVILISAEDDPGDTIRPRLNAAEADVSRVYLLSGIRFAAEDGQTVERVFTLGDLPALEAALTEHPNCKLLIVDPIGSYLGGRTDAHRDNEVRSVLAPVARLAEKFGPAVVVVAHRRKSGGDIADDLALGSRAFTGISRAVWHLTRDPDDKTRRLLLPGKNNLAPEGDGLAFRMIGKPPAIAWESERVVMTADQQLAQENARTRSKPGPEPEARTAAGEWLADLLAAGRMEARIVEDEAKAAHLKWRTVQRAANDLGVIREKAGYGAGMWWRLPTEDAAKAPSTGEPGNLATWHLRGIEPKTKVSTCQDARMPGCQVYEAVAPSLAGPIIDVRTEEER